VGSSSKSIHAAFCDHLARIPGQYSLDREDPHVSPEAASELFILSNARSSYPRRPDQRLGLVLTDCIPQDSMQPNPYTGVRVPLDVAESLELLDTLTPGKALFKASRK
jgi:hypothetical protein